MEEGTVDIGEKLKMSFKNAHSILRYLSRQMAVSPLPAARSRRWGVSEESSDFIFLFISNRLYRPQGEDGGGMQLGAEGTNYDSLHG